MELVFKINASHTYFAGHPNFLDFCAVSYASSAHRFANADLITGKNLKMSVNSSVMTTIQQLLLGRMLTPAGLAVLLDPSTATSTVDTIQRLLEAGMLTSPGLAILLGLDPTASLSALPAPAPAPPATLPPASQVPPMLPISAPLPPVALPMAFHAPMLPMLPPPPSMQSMPSPILSLYQSPAQMLQSLSPTTASSSLPTSFLPHHSGISQLAQRLDNCGADRQRCEHAAAMRTADGEPKKKRRKRSKAVDKPRLEGVDGAKTEDFLQKAIGRNGEVEVVMNVSLQGRLPFPDRDTCKVCLLFFAAL